MRHERLGGMRRLTRESKLMNVCAFARRILNALQQISENALNFSLFSHGDFFTLLQSITWAKSLVKTKGTLYRWWWSSKGWRRKKGAWTQLEYFTAIHFSHLSRETPANFSQCPRIFPKSDGDVNFPFSTNHSSFTYQCEIVFLHQLPWYSHYADHRFLKG